MGEDSKEVWPNEGNETTDVTPVASPGPTRYPTREAMSWIRALANDWEDARSHGDSPK